MHWHPPRGRSLLRAKSARSWRGCSIFAELFIAAVAENCRRGIVRESISGSSAAPSKHRNQTADCFPRLGIASRYLLESGLLRRGKTRGVSMERIQEHIGDIRGVGVGGGSRAARIQVRIRGGQQPRARAPILRHFRVLWRAMGGFRLRHIGRRPRYSRGRLKGSCALFVSYRCRWPRFL